MNFKNRARLTFGILLVLAILGALIVYLNNSMSHVSSITAKLLSDTYSVGTDYSGIVTKQDAVEGQHVDAGTPLFTINSSVFDNNNNATQKDIILKSTGSGTVANIDYIEGSFVPANKEVATITKSGSLYVQASYALSPPDYARIKDGDIVKVTLPNDQTVSASVFDISVQSSGDSTRTVIKARVSGLDASSAFSDGTPVTTQLQLNGKTLYNSVHDFFQKIFQPKG